MMLPLLAAMALLPSPIAQTSTTPPIPVETKAQKDARLKWWREARFGMFVHWGLYAIPAGDWHGKPGGEWILAEAQIKRADYEPLAQQWNPSKFSAKAWVSLAKEAGMKYLVITSKHHEGFGRWPSKQGDWNVGHTPVKTDILRALAKECKAQGVRLCFYHSIMDWHHPDYLPKREWDNADASKADFDRYVIYMKAQLKELLTEYGDIGLLWFDGEWEGTWTHERGVDLYNFVRTLQPKIIVNNRVDTGRGGMEGGGQNIGDYGTPEQTIPANGLPGTDWESCMTMNGTWGYRTADQNWKSTKTLVRNLIDCASKGGNYLLNVGPMADGTIPAASVQRLEEIGKWTKANGVAIYGTTAGPFPRALPWGRITRKGDRLFLHVFEAGDKIFLPGMQAQVVGVKTLVGTRLLPHRSTPEGIEVDLTGVPRDPNATVVELDVRGPVSVVPVLPKQQANRSLDLVAADAEIHGSTAHLQEDNIGYWTDAQDSVSWKFQAVPGEVSVEIEYACDPGSYGATYAVEVNGQTLSGTIESTGSWTTFRRVSLGTVRLDAGRAEVTVRALTVPRGAVMNLRAVRLFRATY